MIQQTTLHLPAFSKGFHLITQLILKQLPPLPDTGILLLFIQHTSAGLTLNENADPTVRSDLDAGFNRLAPEGSQYIHDDEGPDDMPAHIKSTLAGSSVSIPITNHSLNMGTWQGIYLCEFRIRARARTIVATIYY